MAEKHSLIFLLFRLLPFLAVGATKEGKLWDGFSRPHQWLLTLSLMAKSKGTCLPARPFKNNLFSSQHLLCTFMS